MQSPYSPDLSLPHLKIRSRNRLILVDKVMDMLAFAYQNKQYGVTFGYLYDRLRTSTWLVSLDLLTLRIELVQALTQMQKEDVTISVIGDLSSSSAFIQLYRFFGEDSQRITLQ